MKKYFFSGVKNPANASDVITCLAAGVPLQVERLPDDLLPAVILLAAVGIAKRQAIVDDFHALLRKVEAKFSDPNFSHKVFWHQQLGFVSTITASRGGSVYSLMSNPEMQYIIKLYEELVNTDTEELFLHAEETRMA